MSQFIHSVNKRSVCLQVLGHGNSLKLVFSCSSTIHVQMFNIKMLTQKNTKLWLVSQHSLLESRRCFIVQCNHTTSSNSLVFVVFEPPTCHKAFTTHSFQCAGVFFMFSLHLKERTANQKMLNNHHLVLSQKFTYTFH